MNKTSLFLIAALLAMSTGAMSQQPKPLTLTTETRFVTLPESYEWVSDLDEGVWTVLQNYAYAFFLDDGSKLFDFNWQTSASSRDPKMLGGAIIMHKKGELYNKPQYILYRDGTVKELPADYSGAATNFVDGVALIGKKRVGSGFDYIYINTKGERVYGDLVSQPARFDGENHTLPPLREGLRAFKSAKAENFVYRWGYIDANGKVVIPARFEECRSFSNGYALVKENGKIFFIDKNGNKVFEPSWGDDVYFNDVSDVRDGYFVVNYSPRRYYNMKGEKVFEGGHGTWFYEGYAFIDDPNKSSSTHSLVIDKSFRSIARIPYVSSSWNDDGCTPAFSPIGVATVSGERVIAPNGATIIQHYPLIKDDANNYRIDNFSKTGFAKAWLYHNGVRYTGFINLDGEFVIVYDWDKSVEKLAYDPNNPRSPRHPLPISKDSTVTIIPVDTNPKGPKTTTRQSYTVTVTASPANGGSVKGGGSYHLGDPVQLSATPAKGWKLIGWQSNTPGYYCSTLPDGVTIDGRDLSFTASFIKIPEKDEITSVERSGAFCGHNKVKISKTSDFYLDYDIYMELSANKDIKSPYGDNTYGFLTCVLDGTKDVVVPQKVNGKDGTLSLKIFYVPMKVSGIIKDPKDGKRYLVLDGGQVLSTDIRLSGDMLAQMFFNTIFAIEGTLGTASNARYRLELTHYDEDSGECTFGKLYRFHKDLGWVLADDYPTSTKHNFLYSKTENISISSEFLEGVHMKTCGKRPIAFVPPQGWMKDGYDEAVKTFLKEMGNTITEWDEFFSK